MPPVIALIPIIASVILAAAGATALVTALVMAVVTIAAMVATKLLAKKPKGNRLNQGQELQTKINPSLPRTVCVGQTGIGPSCHFAFTYTDDSKKPNRYLVRVLQISDQPISSLLGIFDGKVTLTFTGDITTGWYACNQHRTKSGAAAMWVRVYKGAHTGAVADATLISISGGQWTSAHKGTGLSYAIVKYDYDSDAFPNGEPELVFSVQGAPCYDDRKDSTAGGSGTQRLADPTTWAYSENTAIVMAQYLRGFFINSVKIVGVGAEARDLLPAMLYSAYNTCDQTVAYSGGAEKRYVCGMNMQSDETAEDHLTDLALAMDGKLFDRGGQITIWPGAIRTPVMLVSPQDIDWTAEKSWQPKAGLEAMVNCVQGNFADKDNYYQEHDLPVRTNPTWEADDGGERFSTFLSMRAVNRWSQAQRIMGRNMQSSRYTGVMAVVGGLWLMEMEPGDWFTATMPRWATPAHTFSGKYFEVHELTLTTDLRVALIGTETTTALDDWDHAVDEFTRDDTYWSPPPFDLVVPTFAVAPHSVYDTSGMQDIGFTFTLLSPVGQTGTYTTGVEIQYALTVDLSTTWSAGTISLDQTQKTQGGLLPDTDYSVRARTFDGSRFSDWSDWQSVTTPSTATTYAYVSGPPQSTVFEYDDSTTPSAGTYDRTFGFTLNDVGGPITSGITWTYELITGTLNGFDNTDGPQAMSGTGTGSLLVDDALGGLGTDSAQVRVSATIGANSWIKDTTLTRHYADASGSGGSGPIQLLYKSSGFINLSSGSFTDVTGTLTTTTGASNPGGVSFVMNLNFDPALTILGDWNIEVKLQRLISGVWTDILGTGIDDVGNLGTDTSHVLQDMPGDPFYSDPAFIQRTKNDTGLSASTTYSWRAVARIASGTDTTHLHVVSGFGGIYE